MSVKIKIDIQRRVDTRQIDMLESVIVAFRKTMWWGEKRRKRSDQRNAMKERFFRFNFYFFCNF